MNKTLSRSWLLIEMLFPWFILALLLAFTYAFFFDNPYYGFYFNPSDGQVLKVYVQTEPLDALRPGDMLEQIGSVSWINYSKNPMLVLFDHVKAGQTIDIGIRRNGVPLTIHWVFPGFNRVEFLDRIFNLWWLAYFFWLFGMAIQLFMQPKDVRRRLLIAANYLTGFWLLFGTLSSWQIWGSSVLFHAVTWLAMPVYLHLHWNFPKSLGRVPKFVWGILYFFGSIFALGQLLQLLPKSFYLLGFLVMLAGSITLLVVHFVKQPEQRRAVGLLALAVLIAIGPSVSFGAVGMFGNFPPVGPLALLTLPIMPGAYFYAVYRRQLGGLEVRTNRLITLFIYGALLLTIGILVVFLIKTWFPDSGTSIVVELLFTLLLCLSTAIAFPYFQRWVERRLLGITLPPAQLLELYTARIITSMETEQLRRVICDEVFPSLLIRQAALLRLDNANNLKVVCRLGVDQTQLPMAAEIPILLAEAGRVRSSFSDGVHDQPCPWVRLALPLRIEGKLIGLCLFGRRDPDDLYAATEISTLQALMDQTTLALMNIEQAEYLHALYKADIERHEAERNHLALELHDDVLGQMALLAMSAEGIVETTQFDQAYQAATEHIRQIVDGLHPTMLN